MEEMKDKDPFYRLKEIEIRRGWAIDQIKFVYSDSKAWSVGVDAGRKDAKKVILTQGEWLAKVTHEQLHQRWYAGAGVTFYTNKGRVFSYKPYMAIGTSGEETTMAAAEGKEIIRLIIRKGKLEGIVEQDVPVEEIVEHPSNWFCLVEETKQIWRITHLWDQKELMDKYEAVYGTKIAVDVKNNSILKQKGGRKDLKECRKEAIKAGLLVDSSAEEGNIWDLMRIFTGAFSWRKDFVSFSVTLMLLVLSNFLSGYSHVLTGHVLGSLSNNSTSRAENILLPSFLCGNVVDCHDKTGARKAIFLSFIIVLVLKSLLNSLQIYVHSMLKDSRLFEMKNDLFSHTLAQEMGFYDTCTSGDILSAMNPTVIIDIIAWEVPYLIAEIAKILSSILFMFSINARLATCVLVLLVVFKTGILSPIHNVYKKLCRMDIKINTMIDQTKYESINMISSVKLFSREKMHEEEHMQAQLKLKENISKRNLFRIIEDFTMSMFEVISFIIGLSMMMLDEESYISSGDLTGFFLIFQGIHDQLRQIKNLYVSIIQQLPGAERVMELLERKTKLLSGPLQPTSFTGKVEFQHVTFTYPSRPGHAVLSNFSLSMSPKKVTALVGDSGAGKSTVSNLLMRLYDPDSGSILIDGFGLKELDICNFHKHVAIVNQNPLLFNCSIKDNIAYGAYREVTDEEINDAAKLANAYDFIMSFRGGFDTLAGTMGAQLSGGQKQRLAIARAAIRNPKILILDEATSSLDAENEELVQEALERLMKDKSILVIAHRLSTIRGADEIIVMKDGTVVERGNHQSLLKEKGHYEKLIRKQVM